MRLREREVQLADARRELRQMIDYHPDPVASYSATPGVTSSTPPGSNTRGPPTRLRSARNGPSWPSRDIAGGDKMWRDALAPASHAYRGARPACDGQYRWFCIDRVAARDDENGKIISGTGPAYDIEDRKRAEDALRRAKYKLRQIIDAVPAFSGGGGPRLEPTI